MKTVDGPGPVFWSIARGRGTPWYDIYLVNDNGFIKALAFNPGLGILAHPDGYFYRWMLPDGRRCRLVWPIRAPYFIQCRIKRAVVVVEDHSILGAFEVHAGRPIR